MAIPGNKWVLYAFFGLATVLLTAPRAAVGQQGSRPAAWEARWIAPPDTALHAYGVYHFRKAFRLAARPERFVVHVSADNRYRLYVNGQSVATGPARGDKAHWRYETLDLAPFLAAGDNVLAAAVWNAGPDRPWSQLCHQTGLLVQGDGPAERLVNSDASWKVTENTAYTPLATINHITGPGEIVFARRYPWGWESREYADNAWASAVATEAALPAGAPGEGRRLVPRTIPMPEERPEKAPVLRACTGIPADDAFLTGRGDFQIPPEAKVTLLLDQQYLTTAYPELVVSGGEGSRLTVTYAEALNQNAEARKGNRNEVEGKTMSGDQDVFLPDGGPRRTFRPLTYRTFRYVQVRVENHQAPLTLHRFGSQFTAYPFREAGSFRSSDPTLAGIWNTGWRTARLCAYETYMDCPYYEQLQYVGDTRIQALISLYAAGDDRLVRNAISQFNDSRDTEGLTRSRYPDHGKQIIPPFSLFWIGMIHDYWMHREDTAFVKSFLPGIRDVLDWHRKHVDNQSGMLGVMPYWHFVDWPEAWPWKGREEISGVPAGALEGNSSILTLQYVYALDRAVQLLEAFGHRDEAAGYRQLREKLAAATRERCWDGGRQLLADTPGKREFSQHANVMAGLTGLLPAAERRAVLERVVADTSLIQCTLYYRFYLNQALREAGLGDRYVPMLAPWHDMLKRGLTTFAERPEPTRSDCHAWSASPNYDLLATVCGIRPGGPGFRSVRI